MTTNTGRVAPPNPRTLWVIGTGAGPIDQLAALLAGLAQDGFDCRVILSPSAAALADTKELERLTGHGVLHRFDDHTRRGQLPEPDAVLAAPLTFNSLNKWADGHAGTLALHLMCAALGKQAPIVAVPWFDHELAAHPALAGNMRTLGHAGVRFTRTACELRRPADQGPEIAEHWWATRRLLAKAVASLEAAHPEAWSAVLLSDLLEQITPAAREVLRYLSRNPPSRSYEDVLAHLAEHGHRLTSVQLGGAMTTVRAAHKRIAPKAPAPIGRDQSRRRYLIAPETAAALAAVFSDEPAPAGRSDGPGPTPVPDCPVTAREAPASE